MTPDITFAALGVPEELVDELDYAGITAPFPIQAATLPDALAGRDILGRAKTGSGKTLGFALPLASRLAGGRTAPGRPRGLVLVPTRELATQVQGVLKPLAKAMGLWVATIYGGVSQGPQVAALRRRTDIVVACPGRLADLIGQGHCDLSDVEITVIDEADQMADLGFLPIVRRLLESTPPDGQRLLFSATLDSAIDVLARRFLNDPAKHSVDEHFSPAEIEHHVITIDPGHRLDVLAALAGGDKRSLVFTRTKHGAERLARQLTASGIPAAELHGNLRQGARSRNLAAFGAGAVRVMVATDIAARGIHVDGVELVIHADPPAEHKAYVHRSGRTARGGADGVVVTMQTKAQAREVTSLMRKAGVTPRVAAADPDSEVLREIAGPPAPRVTLDTAVTELVRPEDRFSGPADAGRAGSGRAGSGRAGSGRGRAGKPWARRGDSDGEHRRKPRLDREDRRARAELPADAGRPVRDERPARGGRSERFDRAGRPGAGGRRDHDERAGDGWFERENGRPRDGWNGREGSRPRDGWHQGDRRYQRDSWRGRDDRRERPAAERDSWRGRDDRRERPAGDWHAREDRRGQREDSWRGQDDRRGQRDGYPRGQRGGYGRGDARQWDGDRGRGEWAPSDRSHGERGSQAAASRPSRAGGRPETGGRRGGATPRSGYPARRSAAGKRRNPGQGRHF